MTLLIPIFDKHYLTSSHDIEIHSEILLIFPKILILVSLKTKLHFIYSNMHALPQELRGAPSK